MVTELAPMMCPKCKVPMNQHAEKLVISTDNEALDPVLGGVVHEMHTCPQCGGGASRQARS